MTVSKLSTLALESTEDSWGTMEFRAAVDRQRLQFDGTEPVSRMPDISGPRGVEMWSEVHRFRSNKHPPALESEDLIIKSLQCSQWMYTTPIDCSTLRQRRGECNLQNAGSVSTTKLIRGVPSSPRRFKAAQIMKTVKVLFCVPFCERYFACLGRKNAARH